MRQPNTYSDGRRTGDWSIIRRAENFPEQRKLHPRLTADGALIHDVVGLFQGIPFNYPGHLCDPPLRGDGDHIARSQCCHCAHGHDARSVPRVLSRTSARSAHRGGSGDICRRLRNRR